MYSQNDEDAIKQADFGLHKNVILIAVCLSRKRNVLLMENVDEYIYEKSIQKKLYKQY